MNSPIDRMAHHTRIASKNLEAIIEDEAERTRASIVLASFALFDISRRTSFRERYALLTERDQRLVTESEFPTDPLAGAIIDLHKHVALILEERKASPFWAGDVSVELAATTQLGDWDKGGGLDDELRELPQSALLRENGLTFTDTYGDPSDASVSYRFADFHGQLSARRTRAAGDILHEDKTKIRVIKQSQFVLDETRLSTIATVEAREAAMEYEAVKDSKCKKLPEAEIQRDKKLTMLKHRMTEIGLELIEPAVTCTTERNKDVLPVSSQYYALLRTRDNQT